MRIFKSIQKAIAGVIAGVMIALGCISTIPASAAAAESPVPGSALQYDVSASIATVNPYTGKPFNAPRIKVSITTTTNPGFYYLVLAIKHDSECAYEVFDCSHEATVCTVIEDKEEGYSMFIFRTSGDISTKEAFSVDLYYEVANLNMKAHEFSVGTMGYHSTAEKITNYEKGITELPEDAFVEDDTKNISYVLGDLDNDGNIDADDSYYVLNILAASENSSVTVIDLNNSLANGEAKFRERCPMLICAEVADVDDSRIITQTDSNLILNYYAAKSAGKNPISKIGKSRVKTVSL
ncbi:hypothetical protein [Ruminococcus sp.]|uniref:hypothetical protein n=1 Tax=Ruminococcus sp. TaxID=41978 RepID=UPI0025FF561E|nr:hypothetical protein [Ruminococcus sp.]